MTAAEGSRMALIVSEEYQDATTSTYSPTMSELPLRSELDIPISPGHHTDVG